MWGCWTIPRGRAWGTRRKVLSIDLPPTTKGLGVSGAHVYFPRQQHRASCPTCSHNYRRPCAAHVTPSGPISKEGNRGTEGKGPPLLTCFSGKELELEAGLLRAVQATE